jgi:hypothetical protein
MFPPAWSDRLGHFFSDVSVQFADRAGHFTPLEAREEFTSLIASLAG